MAQGLTPAETDLYRRSGYAIIKRPVFAPAEFQKLKAYMMGQMAQHKTSEGKPLQLIDCPHWHDPQYFQWMTSDAMLDLVEPILGPDIAIFACHLLQKPPRTGKRVPWHKDSMYWQDMLTPLTVTSVTLALEPSIKANSCLRVIAGSHDDIKKDYDPVANPEESVFTVEVRKTQVDESKAVDLELQPNEASLHDGKIIHGSNLNQSDILRAVWTVRYFPTTVKFDTSFSDYFKKHPFHVFLARGKDRAGNRYSEPGKVAEQSPGVSTA